MTTQELRHRKLELGLSDLEISRRTGIPVSTLEKIFSGRASSPYTRASIALESLFSADDSYSFGSDLSIMNVSETLPAYAVQEKGPYTLEDYYALPDDRRVELIDGFFYDMATPYVIHQRILSLLFYQFLEGTRTHDSPCTVLISPCDVQLDRDNKTMLQPDLFILCRPLDIRAQSSPGAPDLTLEILSPSTRSKDMLLKLSKYQHAGVREYWVVDPDAGEVYVYFFEEKGVDPEICSFKDRIPVHISGGECQIDFSEIYEDVKRYYE